jgi:two-component sensor histidine kinase
MPATAALSTTGPGAARRGFGTRLIEGSVAAELGGRARMTYAPEGLRCEIVVPLDAVIADPDRPAPDWAV